MKKDAYKKNITKQMKQLGTYSPEFDLLIDTLAQTCEFRDKNMEEWTSTGGEMVINYTNKAGATNVSKSPYYLNNLQFNEQILKYAKELCLSPTGIKKLGNPLADQNDDYMDFMEDTK